LPHQFDIVGNLNPASRAQYPYIVILQHDRMASIRSVIAAPLVEWTSALASSRIHPSITVNGRRYVALIEELAAVPQPAFGERVGSAEAQRYEIIAALDLLFTGI
jgi:toxin CcdB